MSFNWTQTTKSVRQPRWTHKHAVFFAQEEIWELSSPRVYNENRCRAESSCWKWTADATRQGYLWIVAWGESRVRKLNVPALWFCLIAPWGGPRCCAHRSGPPRGDRSAPEGTETPGSVQQNNTVYLEKRWGGGYLREQSDRSDNFSTVNTSFLGW